MDKGSEFYNRSIKSWFQDNGIEMYSKYNEEKSAVAETFIRTLKNKIYKYVTSTSKNVYIDKLDGIVNKYNNTYHSTIKMKPVDVNSSTYINFNKENNKEDLKFKAVVVREILLQMAICQIGQKKCLWLKKVKILCCYHMLLVILTVKKYWNVLQKIIANKQIKKSSELKTLSTKQMTNYMLNGKASIIFLKVWLIKKT